jgi:hypothetical protein
MGLFILRPGRNDKQPWSRDFVYLYSWILFFIFKAEKKKKKKINFLADGGQG